MDKRNVDAAWHQKFPIAVSASIVDPKEVEQY
jgi:hypothetical protein